MSLGRKWQLNFPKIGWEEIQKLLISFLHKRGSEQYRNIIFRGSKTICQFREKSVLNPDQKVIVSEGARTRERIYRGEYALAGRGPRFA